MYCVACQKLQPLTSPPFRSVFCQQLTYNLSGWSRTMYCVACQHLQPLTSQPFRRDVGKSKPGDNTWNVFKKIREKEREGERERGGGEREREREREMWGKVNQIIPGMCSQRWLQSYPVTQQLHFSFWGYGTSSYRETWWRASQELIFGVCQQRWRQPLPCYLTVICQFSRPQNK